MNLRDVKNKENREGAIAYFCINLYTQCDSVDLSPKP